jgi:hypothetical protein
MQIRPNFYFNIANYTSLPEYNINNNNWVVKMPYAPFASPYIPCASQLFQYYTRQQARDK